MDRNTGGGTDDDLPQEIDNEDGDSNPAGYIRGKIASSQFSPVLTFSEMYVEKQGDCESLQVSRLLENLGIYS